MRKTTFLIVGKHAVIEALKNPSRKIERVFLTEEAQKKLNRENQSLNLLRNMNVFYRYFHLKVVGDGKLSFPSQERLHRAIS